MTAVKKTNPHGHLHTPLREDPVMQAAYAAYAANERTYHEQEAEEVSGDGPLDFPAKLQPLFHPKRNKVVRGGRGGAKSWGIARALLIMGANRTLRICCFREIQKNIKESVHQLLRDQIDRMGLHEFYDVQEETIIGQNGTAFIFAGLSQITDSSVKSYEGIDIAWIEEAQTVRRRSWALLIPTIRKRGSEIWVSFNPELETDPTYEIFVDGADKAHTISIEVNWRDNPWLTPELHLERAKAKAQMRPDEYNNVWEGRCRAAVTGAIYADEMSDLDKDGRICNVPHDRRLLTHIVMDLGWNDKMFAILVQVSPVDARVVAAYQDDHKTIGVFLGEIRAKHPGWAWGKVWLPHDGAHGDFKTGKSTHRLLREEGWVTGVVPNVPVETGIKRARMLFERIYIDATKALVLITALRRYKRNENPKSEEFDRPVHDDASHGGDGWRYLGLCIDKMKNALEKPTARGKNLAHYPMDPEMGL